MSATSHKALKKASDLYNSFLRNTGTVKAPEFPVPIDDLILLVEKSTKVVIEVSVVSSSPQGIKGMLIRKNIQGHQSAQILLADHLNDCWRRFVLAKELCHIFLDVDNDFTADIVQLIDDLIYSATPIPTAAVTSEFIAYLCAIELLLPSPYVQAVKNMIQQLGVSSLKVAHTFNLESPVDRLPGCIIWRF